MLQRTKEILILTCLNLLETKLDHHDIDMYWPTTIKYIIQWFTFLTIMEHTVNIINLNKGTITSLVRLFAMFELCLVDDKDKLDAVSIMCINCKKETGLFLIN